MDASYFGPTRPEAPKFKNPATELHAIGIRRCSSWREAVPYRARLRIPAPSPIAYFPPRILTIGPYMERSIPEKIQRIIGPLPGQREARAFSVFALIAGLVACGLSLYYGFRGETFMGRPMGSDFVRVLRGRQAAQSAPARASSTTSPRFRRLQHEVVPEMSPTQMLCSATLRWFRSCSVRSLSCRTAGPTARGWYFRWRCMRSSLWLLFRAGLRASYRRTAFLLALSAPMYTLETWIGGQLSVIGFFAVVLFICCFEKRWPLLAGLALGLATYKPSLVAIPAAMMIVGGCWRMLAGLSVSSALMILGSIATGRSERLLAVDRAAASVQRYRHQQRSHSSPHQVRGPQFVLHDSAGRKFAAERVDCHRRDVGGVPDSGVELVAVAPRSRTKFSAICGQPRSPGPC